MKIICVARLVKTKRIDQLIAAVKLAHDQLTIIGFGPQERQLKQLAGKKVRFLQLLPRKELIAEMKQADIFCLPSVVEGFGIATIEAMACGLPAVLADIPVNREITRNGQGAVLFQPESISDLAAKLKLIRRLYPKKQAEALALAKTYSWDRIYRETKAVYETCFHH